MDYYTPLFSKIVDSSLWQESLEVRVLFTTLLSKQDHDHVVRGSLYNISRWANMGEQETIDAMEVLMSPDTKRIEKQEFDGKRVRREGPEEWRLLNGEKYQRAMQTINQRLRWARAQQMKRERDRNKVGATAAEKNAVEREKNGQV